MQNLEKLQDLATKLPKGLKENAEALVEKMGQVIEGVGDKPIEWRPDTLKVVQATTDRSRLPKGTNIGSMIIGEDVMAQPLGTIPLRMWDTRQLWSPDRDDAKLLCWSPDGVVGYTLGRQCKDCDYGKFNTETNRSECNKSKTAISVTSDLSKVYVVNFSKTNFANGKDWQGLMKKAGVAPFKRIYHMKTEPNKKFKNVEALVVDTTTEASPKEAVDFLQELFNRVSADREAYVANIHKIVADKQNTQVLVEGPTGEADGLVALDSATPASSTQTSMASKYSV